MLQTAPQKVILAFQQGTGLCMQEHWTLNANLYTAVWTNLQNVKNDSFSSYQKDTDFIS